MTEIAIAEAPFDKRHLCWFCEEPADGLFHFISPREHEHPSVAISACKECRLIAKSRELDSLYECRMLVKDTLIQRYAKHLAIGSNWTKAELEDSGFDCKILGGFKKSAWFMYEVARDRVNAAGWPVSVNGLVIDDGSHGAEIEHDGVKFTTLTGAARHFSHTQGLDEQFICALVKLLGRQRFAYALRLASLYRAANSRQKQELLSELHEDEQR
ncbi:hypothetical protein KJI95_15185 [Shewanella sp. JM162201]|uniref:Uncharacterized protein n=1 Tax=Shewanella jiangmenensis TaxID=2837387 RepID=A0ABS5V821_9GAMM|nr:hypothetical protein [Shewanella jiangmenensis]MBT1445849.1 hypothetical protein [Shewanella jiangmenensis]